MDSSLKPQQDSGWNNGGSECCFPGDIHCGSSEKEKFGHERWYEKVLTDCKKKKKVGKGQGTCDPSALEEKLTAMKYKERKKNPDSPANSRIMQMVTFHNNINNF